MALRYFIRVMVPERCSLDTRKIYEISNRLLMDERERGTNDITLHCMKYEDAEQEHLYYGVRQRIRTWYSHIIHIFVSFIYFVHVFFYSRCFLRRILFLIILSLLSFFSLLLVVVPREP